MKFKSDLARRIYSFEFGFAHAYLYFCLIMFSKLIESMLCIRKFVDQDIHIRGCKKNYLCIIKVCKKEE